MRPPLTICPNLGPRLQIAVGRRQRKQASCGVTGMLIVAAVTACEVVKSDSAATTRDSGAAAVVPESARGTIATDSAVPVVSSRPDSARLAVVDDTGIVRIYPAEPRRGGVVFALAEGVSTPTARCSWKSAPIPCYHANRRNPRDDSAPGRRRRRNLHTHDRSTRRPHCETDHSRRSRVLVAS